MDSRLHAELLERERELAALEAALAESGDDGRVVVIEGEGGIGKTRLLDVARDRSREEGRRVLSARASELERGFPFGVARQLFEPALRAVDGERRSAWLNGAARHALDVLGDAPPAQPAGPDTGFIRLHGLYWLCANIAEEQGLLIAVDDLQWADEGSLEFLGFLARRLEGLALLLVAATRPRATPAAPLLDQLGRDPATTLLYPTPLSEAGVSDRVRAVLGDAADPEFCAACRTATNGNPLLLTELLREVADEGLPPSAGQAERVAELAPRRVSQLVLLRLARLPEAAGALACALAVLGEKPTLAYAAEVAGLDEEAAGEAAAALVRGEVLAPGPDLAFVHPIVRAAVYEDMPAHSRMRAHSDAVRALRARGAGPLELAPQLLAVDPADDPEAVETLRAAAAGALRLGDPATAVSCLRRALAEPPPDDRLADTLAELGAAEARTGEAGGIDHLSRAVELTPQGSRQVERQLELARLLKFAGRPADAVEQLRAAETQLGDGDGDGRVADAIRVELLSSGQMSAAARELVEGDVEALLDPGTRPTTFLERFTLVAIAWERTATLTATAGEVARLAGRALEGEGLPGELGHGGHALGLAATVLLFAEQLERAELLATDALDAARSRGSAFECFHWLGLRAVVRSRTGRLLGAEEDATAALDLAETVRGSESLVGIALAARIEVALERGDDGDELRAVIDRFLGPGDGGAPRSSQAVRAHAQLLGERGEPRAGLDELREIGALGPTWGSGNPAMLQWRSTAALLHHRLGEESEARELALEEVELARRFGAPRALGVALRAAGLVTGGARGAELLDEAVAALSESPAQLERARALVDLGAALRRGRRRSAARDPLREGLDLAARCGATRLAGRAEAELRASGARPRRTALSGGAALTPSERRVAELVAQGLSNREVAQTLFVTAKTVETHLGHVYGKLGIRSRRELADALAKPDPD